MELACSFMPTSYRLLCKCKDATKFWNTIGSGSVMHSRVSVYIITHS